LAAMDLPEGLIITDVGSTKKQISEIARKTLPPHVRFIGGHPMAGSEKSGPAAADPFLFQNAVYVMAPLSEKMEAWEERFSDFLTRGLGCKCIFLNPGVHDAIAATVSHTPHLLAVALVNLARRVEQKIPGTLQMAAGGFRDLTRIASSPYQMWRDIFATNKEAISPLIDECIEILGDMKKELMDGSLESHFNDAHDTRGEIPLDSKGFISQPHEIMVIVKDQPGVIALIATAIAYEGINIIDIELLKIREGEAGTLKMAFDSEEKAERAVEILKREGVCARKR
ncbi:MAG: prephenate dehydrogenase/arogenate dehydrogenase family protein, partial [Desulfobacterales bacterium]|nr:prephenate dehydrogenase/arogenate dehydrogenase family protein [Desulfobacterales bacterium]